MSNMIPRLIKVRNGYPEQYQKLRQDRWALRRWGSFLLETSFGAGPIGDSRSASIGLMMLLSGVSTVGDQASHSATRSTVQSTPGLSPDETGQSAPRRSATPRPRRRRPPSALGLGEARSRSRSPQNFYANIRALHRGRHEVSCQRISITSLTKAFPGRRPWFSISTPPIGFSSACQTTLLLQSLMSLSVTPGGSGFPGPVFTHHRGPGRSPFNTQLETPGNQTQSGYQQLVEFYRGLARRPADTYRLGGHHRAIVLLWPRYAYVITRQGLQR